MNSFASCPQCGRPLPDDAPSGTCPQCLLGVAMQTASQADTFDRLGGFTPPKPHQLAQHFPQLEILDLVGHGGMGAVYKARQRGLDRLVALKILPPEVGKDPSFAERFAREARALARLSHPNIVGVHDSGHVGEFYYVLMEFVDGINLREAIQTNELTPHEALAIVPQVCEALQYAHDEGVVHRDIKPENILLDKKGRVKIADFGLARLLGKAPDNFTLTGPYQVMGTPRYMAPEQMEGSHEVDHRADIYSLGVVFYEMLTGELPLGRFDVPSRKVQLDARVDEVVLRTLEKEPSRRYQQASEIKTAVESIGGTANLPPHLRRMYGCNYRSKTEIFGWPLIHIATGIDPNTGRKRVAKGVVAIGDVAIGVFALGGAAIGVFASGGAAVGLFSFGGAALGLLIAVGGAAIGLGFSIGGLAVGSVALGGMAVGYYAFGGGAFAVHGMSGMGRDPAAMRFFDSWAEPFMKGFPIVTTIGVILMVGGMTLIVALAKRHGEKEPIPPKTPPKESDPPRLSTIGCAVLGVLMVLATGGCFISMIAVWSYQSLQYESARAEAEEMSARQAAEAHVLATQRDMEMRQQLEEELQKRNDAGQWTLTDAGPQLNEYGIQDFNLSQDQVPRVNQVLQDVYRRYLDVEQRHMTRRANELGHVEIKIDKFTDLELAELKQSLWARLDEILDIEQQQNMRINLHLYPMADTGNPGRPNWTNWKPGLLGWANSDVHIELWKVGTWFHSKIHADTGLGLSPQITSEAPELPVELRRFWQEDTVEATNEKALKQS